jgi:hypothetical protein
VSNFQDSENAVLKQYTKTHSSNKL